MLWVLTHTIYVYIYIYFLNTKGILKVRVDFLARYDIIAMFSTAMRRPYCRVSCLFESDCCINVYIQQSLTMRP